jgi:hypothetical protein
VIALPSLSAPFFQGPLRKRGKVKIPIKLENINICFTLIMSIIEIDNICKPYKEFKSKEFRIVI